MGAHEAHVYSLYTREDPDESNDTYIFVRHSDDDGATWSTPMRINDDTGTNSQFAPRIAIDQTTGFLAATWHDARKDKGLAAAVTRTASRTTTPSTGGR